MRKEILNLESPDGGQASKGFLQGCNRSEIDLNGLLDHNLPGTMQKLATVTPHPVASILARWQDSNCDEVSMIWDGDASALLTS